MQTQNIRVPTKASPEPHLPSVATSTPLQTLLVFLLSFL